MEVWKSVKGYEGLYAISNYGRVKNIVTDKVRSPINNGKGYYKLELRKDKIGKRHYIHRMVAEAFLPNPHNKTEVNHKDGKPSNNHISNLEWVTSSENSKHAVYKGALKAWGNEAKPIEAINLDNGMVTRFATISEAERALGTRHITDVLKGRRNQCKGYTFKYIGGGDACANFEYISS
jgi:hypothetical protein